MNNDTITDEEQTIIDAYLVENDYASLEEWAEDSDYLYDDELDEWFDGIEIEGLTHPMGNMVDLRVQLLIAIAAAALWDEIDAGVAAAATLSPSALVDAANEAIALGDEV
jgi:hypothetical protein